MHPLILKSSVTIRCQVNAFTNRAILLLMKHCVVCDKALTAISNLMLNLTAPVSTFNRMRNFNLHGLWLRSFPFTFLQPTGGGNKTLTMPSVSSSYQWTAQQVAKLATSRGSVYIMAMDDLYLRNIDSEVSSFINL
jgi:hypothetical protein